MAMVLGLGLGLGIGLRLGLGHNSVLLRNLYIITSGCYVLGCYIGPTCRSEPKRPGVTKLALTSC